MSPLLDVEVSLSGGRPHRLRLATTSVVVGRSREADVRLPAEQISGAHARVMDRDGALWVEDLGSANGTWLRGERLPAGQPQRIPDSGELQVGPYTLRVGYGDADDDDQNNDTDALAAHLVRSLMSTGAAPPATLRVRDPTSREQSVVLTPGQRLTVGRDPGCGLTIDDLDLSREHAVFLLDDAGATVQDLDSKNGVLRRGERLHGATRLHHGDELTLGGTTLRFEDAVEAWLDELPEPESEPESAAESETVTESIPPPSKRTAAPTGSLTRGAVITLALAVMVAAIWALIRLFA